MNHSDPTQSTSASPSVLPPADLAGVSGMAVYVPRLRIPLEAWCQWTDNEWNKVQSVIGRSFRVLAAHENVYTMAANSVLRLIRQNDIDPQQVGFLGLGTESSTDNAVGSVIVRGMVDKGLEHYGLPRLSRQLEVPEFKHACLGGIYALKNAVRYVSCDGGGRTAIVVSADVAEYERGTTGEQTQGAGAVAALIEQRARMFGVDLANAGSASDYRGPDFRKPFARHFTEGYAPQTRRPSDFPVFSGKYSTVSYLDETVHAVEAMLARLKVSEGQYYRDVQALFFHRPYHLMPVQAMSFLYVRGLVRGEHHKEELRSLCEEAEVSLEDLQRETNRSPDLFAHLADHAPDEATASSPYEATSRAASRLRKRPQFTQLLTSKMSLGSSVVQDLGNLYSAALPAWIAAGFEEAASRNLNLDQAPLVAVGYGSGDAAESIPLRASPEWKQAASKIALGEAMANPIDLTQAQYEALHDLRQGEGIACEPSLEFAIDRVGDNYAPGFQDLGVEYYRFVG